MPEPQPIRLLIHASTPEALQRARRNAANLLKAEPSAQVEIVVNAGAVAAALAQPDATDTHLAVCANTLAAGGLQAPEGLTVVSAAVLHLARRQQEGWAYMHA
ncbi:Uncharacterized conserved protein [Bordetella ansorpii]|uniref:Uncharacterized conserved protein n=1 Tax=Bordetella ansorpii TaxID=288768 RepID=A0A157Q476_9BORD|nr:hypothetical protein [Bordetella ansorpii]SAI40672.1 Uncharacterized conserved protein [Bordetella ansorpii]